VRQHRANVDIVEFLELKAVDRDDGVVELHFLTQMNPHKAAYVAVSRQYQRMALAEHSAQAFAHAWAESVEAPERRRAAPRHEDRHRRIAVAEVEALDHHLD